MTAELKIVEDLPEENETTYSKGHELETDFSIFMKRELNWEKVRVGAHLPGKLNRKGAAVDVIGERLDARGKKFHSFGISWIIFSLISIGLSIFCIATELGTGEFFLTIAILLLAGAIIFMVQSSKFNKENAWVECKNLKGKVNINQIDKSLREKKDYDASGDKEYKFSEHYFVSASGFMENALKYAIEHSVICYEKKGGSFVKVGYWD